MTDGPIYEVYAIRYGHLAGRRRYENFLSLGARDELMPLDYYVWAIRNHERTIVVDTGFDEAEGRRRGRLPLRPPRTGLTLLGIDSRQVEDVVITHLHYDHSGTIADFPRATFHLQDLEMTYATGRHMCHEALRSAYSVQSVAAMVERVYAGQVRFHDGDAELAPGVSVHRIGGHTLGLQCVRVRTARGWLVLASDASHFYENMERASPFPIVHDVGAMLNGYRMMYELAGAGGPVIPGHDPLVMERYPAPSKEMEGIVVRLDAGEPL